MVIRIISARKATKKQAVEVGISYQTLIENPDGTAITFDSDFLGNHRGLSTIPGPFADAAAAESVLWNK